MKAYMNTTLTPAERAKLLLREMTLEEKMAQIVGFFALKGYEDRMAPFFKNGIGQISTLEFRSEGSLQEISAWQRKLQTMVLENSRLGIPAVFHMEGLCGPLMQDTTTFPSGVARGASFDPALERQIGETVSRQEAALGITQILAPVLDISRDSRMGRQCEPYGEDPTLAAAMGAAYTHGIQETETDGRTPDAAAKHFFGFHNSAGGIHGAHVDAGDRLLLEIYGKPFQAAIAEAGLKGIMPCYGSLNGLPIHASHHYLTDILRGEMGFDGVTVSCKFSSLKSTGLIVYQCLQPISIFTAGENRIIPESLRRSKGGEAAFKFAFMAAMAKEYTERNWVMQLHYGCRC